MICHSPSHLRAGRSEVKGASTAFKRVVRDLEFDVAELAIVTFLLARAHGKPLVLLPVVVLGRLQHPYLVYNQERGPLSPKDLAGRRVGLVVCGANIDAATFSRHLLDAERSPA